VKAILHTQYGSPDLLRFKKVDKPAPKDNEVLIRVHATTVSTGDCNMRNFTFITKSMLPMAKLMFGIGKPWKERILGTELAGEVVGAGKNVTRFKVGDRVFGSTGMAGGGHACSSTLEPPAIHSTLRYQYVRKNGPAPRLGFEPAFTPRENSSSQASPKKLSHTDSLTETLFALTCIRMAGLLGGV
jgi:NADPH:quinone reductase-like Zn-dependent oxidoreductase